MNQEANIFISDPELRESQIQDILSLVADINRYLGNQPIAEIDFSHKQSSSAVDHMNTTKVTLSRHLFSNPEIDPNPTTWHELSHIYYRRLKGPDIDFLRTRHWYPFGEKMIQLYSDFLDASFHNPQAHKISNIDNLGVFNVHDFKRNSLTTIFNSLAYQNENPENGRPYDSERELFAHTSEILRYYPENFRKKANNLSTTREKNLAMEIARQVASKYKINDKFPERLQMLEQFCL